MVPPVASLKGSRPAHHPQDSRPVCPKFYARLDLRARLRRTSIVFQGISLTKAQVARFGGEIARFGSVYDDARDAIVMSADS
jgi:hypothetical protein